jgi:hypothetical protein
MHKPTVCLLSAVALTACTDASSADDIAAITSGAAAPPAGRGDAFDHTHTRGDTGDLSAAQARTIRLDLDLICGDTWCAGDFDFAFEKVTCHFDRSSCTVTMRISPRQDARPVPNYWRACKVGGVHAFPDVVVTAPSGYSSLHPAFYERMTTCTIQIVARLPPPARSP